MKKTGILFSITLTTLSLMAFGFISWNNSVTEPARTSKKVVQKPTTKIFPEFLINVGTRFVGIKKADVDKAKSINDFLQDRPIKSIESVRSLAVIILEDSRQTDIQEFGNSEKLTPAQIELLQSSDYSTNILIRANYQTKNNKTGELKNNHSTPHLTIVPEKQAAYANGKNALIQYLKDNSFVKTILVQQELLQQGRMYFTITKEGTISDVNLAATSGYVSVDETMMELMAHAPGKWEPAENANGEKVDQTLVLFFGEMGC